MSDSVVDALILDLLEWLASGDREYPIVIEAWRTSCPRLPVWEDAKDRGLIAIHEAGRREIVRPTPLGLALLQRERKLPQHPAPSP